MAEKQHPFVEHESSSDETAELSIIKPHNNRANSHPHVPPPFTLQEEQRVSVLQDENQHRTANGLYAPEVDENLIPTLKIPALKRSQLQPSAQQPPPVLHVSEKELSVELSAYPPAPIAQQPDTPVTIVDDYDFSEIDVDIVDIISYSLFQQNIELATAEPAVLAIDDAPSPPLAEHKAETLATLAFEAPVEGSTLIIEREASAPTEEEIPASDSEIQIPAITEEEAPAPDIVAYDEEAITSTDREIEILEAPVEAHFIAPPAQHPPTVGPDNEEVDSDVQLHAEDQPPPVEQEVLAIISGTVLSVEPDTSEKVEETTSETDTAPAEQEDLTIASLPPSAESILTYEESIQEELLSEERIETPDIPLPASIEEHPLTEAAPDELLTESIDTSALPETPLLASTTASPLIEEAPEEIVADHTDTTTVPDASLSDSAEQNLLAEEVVEAPTDTADIASEQALPPQVADTLLPSVLEEHVETEPTSGEEDNHQIIDEQSVAVEAPPAAKEPIGVDAVVETEIDTTDASSEPASVEVIPVTPTSEQPPDETQVVIVKRRKHTLSRHGIASLILLALFTTTAILLWRDLTDTHVYLNAIDPNNGKVLTQQDFGGYQDTITLTAPVYESSQLYVGIHSNDPQGTQQVISLTSSSNSWHVTAQIAAPLAHGTLSGTSDGHLFAVDANGLQVMTANSHKLWSLQSEQPSQGTHSYQPISDSRTLYAVASLKRSQVAAYDLQSGTRRWVQMLDDTLEDVPPFLLDEDTLYIASDYKLYALNSGDGSLRWEKAYPSRTLLLENEGGTPLLVAAGAQGLTALNPDTGALAWSFNGQPGDMYTPAQFYQAAIASANGINGNVIYATGIVWQMSQVQAQVWLYAVNAVTGTPLWSQQVGSGFVSADAGRTLLPLVDTTHGIVVLQQQLSNNQQRITAFDINTGTPRWSTLMGDISGSSPTLARTSDGTLILFTTALNSRRVLFTPSLLRIFLIMIFAITFIILLFRTASWLRMGISYLQQYREPLRHTVSTLQRNARAPFQRFALLSPLPRTLVILLLLSIFGGLGTLGYAQLNQPQNTLYQVAALNGTIQWQQRMTTPTQALTTDAEGSIITTSVGDHLHQLQALTHDGTVRWKAFSSQGVFSVPPIASSPGTLVVGLQGDASPTYQFAPADVAYPYAIDHLLVLYVLNRSTGTPLWQHILVYPDEQQHAVILGADSSYIYIAGTQIHPAPGSTGATIQLFAVNRTTGTIDWRVFGPTEPSDGPHDDGQLLLKEGQAIWQVAGTIYAIDTTVGQIEWRRQIADDDLSALVQEDQMTEAAGTLLVLRSHDVHGLDPSTGNELWTLPSKGASTPQSTAGVAVVGQTILVYANGQIEAFDAIDRHSLWQHFELDAIQHLSVSEDGKTIYLIEVSNVPGSSPALVALSAQTGITEWTFEPARQATFPFASPESFLSGNKMLFLTVCFPSGQEACAHERLYALGTETGKPAWTFTGHRISDLHLSKDGKTLLFSVNTSVWTDLMAHLRG